VELPQSITHQTKADAQSQLNKWWAEVVNKTVANVQPGGYSSAMASLGNAQQYVQAKLPWAQDVMVESFDYDRSVGIAIRVGDWQRACRYALPMGETNFDALKTILDESCQIMTDQFLQDAERPMQTVNQRGCLQ